jgi:hypothetical protein
LATQVYAAAYQAKDLRPIAQDYNMRRGEIEEEERQAAVVVAQLVASAPPEVKLEQGPPLLPQVSEWADFIDEV